MAKMVTIERQVVATTQAAVMPGASYLGACDASAAVHIDSTHFAVASDEPTSTGENVLHIYERDTPQPVGEVDLGDYLFKSKKKFREIDLEAADRIDDRVYWLSSHGNDSDGSPDRARCHFFATDVVNGRLRPTGKSYRNLLQDLADAEELSVLRLDDLLSRNVAPKEGGFNIEGLATRADGTLLIGLRSPTFDNKAALLPLRNPNEVIEKGERARFDKPLLVDLGGNGIRDITYDPKRGIFIILAGASKMGRGRSLYIWTGGVNDRPLLLDAQLPEDINAESLYLDQITGLLRVFSDDGDRMIENIKGKLKKNKDHKDAHRSFRSLWVVLQ